MSYKSHKISIWVAFINFVSAICYKIARQSLQSIPWVSWNNPMKYPTQTNNIFLNLFLNHHTLLATLSVIVTVLCIAYVIYVGIHYIYTKHDLRIILLCALFNVIATAMLL